MRSLVLGKNRSCLKAIARSLVGVETAAGSLTNHICVENLRHCEDHSRVCMVSIFQVEVESVATIGVLFFNI